MPTLLHRRRWRTTLRRGAILGSVIALHLTAVALLLRPAPPYRSLHRGTTDGGRPLRISFVPRPKPAPPRRAAPSPQRPLIAPRHHGIAAAPPVATAAPSQAIVITLPASAPGDYRSAALDGTQPVPAARLPGAATLPRGVIRLRDRHSMRDIVRTMTAGSRCKYVHMKMARSTTQFVTRQLSERALEADGCGPQVEHAASRGAVEAISRRAIFGN
jgi:hypothetical protein